MKPTTATATAAAATTATATATTQQSNITRAAEQFKISHIMLEIGSII